jgi:primosomal protein N' (replication factor Y)
VLLGPAEAPIFRISGRYRYQILLKAPTTKLRHRFLNDWLFDAESPIKETSIKIQVDIDPYTML